MRTGVTVWGLRASSRVLRAFTLVTLVGSLASGCAFLSKKRQFLTQMYPKKPSLPPAVDHDLTVSGALTPLVSAGFDAPRNAAACLEQALAIPHLAKDIPLSDEFRHEMATLIRYARCVEDAQLKDEPAVTTCAPVLRPLIAGCGGWASPDDLDRARVLRALADVAEALDAGEHAGSGQTWEPAGGEGWSGPPRCGVQGYEERCHYERAVVRSLALGVELLRRDPIVPAKTPHRTALPVLAMSGGAANGAFTAGFMHALLHLRTTAIGATGDPRKRQELELRTRFGSLAGTSVGSLVALLVDFYYAPASSNACGSVPEDPGPEIFQEVLPADKCGNANTGRGNEECALAGLQNLFGSKRVEEGTLLCVERGSVISFLSAKKNPRGRRDHLLRFDPLERDLLRPFFARYGCALMGNDVLRVTVATDLTQNAVLGLDERACRIDGVPSQECLVSAVLTSITEPVFVPPVRRVYSGLRLGEGEGSARGDAARFTWFDGGLRSGTPALFALLLSGSEKPRVLALTTAPAEGVTKVHPKNGLGTFFDATFDAVDQVRKWEIGYAQVVADQRRHELGDFCRVLGLSHCPGRSPAAAAAPADATCADPASPPAPLSQPAPAAAASSAPVAPSGSPPEASPATRDDDEGRMRALPSFRPSDMVLPVFVPDFVQPRALLAAGYQFDPVMMEGLYLWGEWTFLTGHQRVLEFLGWDGLDAGDAAGEEIDTELKRVKRALCDGFGAGPGCSNPNPDVLLKDSGQLREYYKAQRKRARKSMTRCPSE